MRLGTKRLLIAIVLVVALVGLSGWILKTQADAAASRYIQASKKHFAAAAKEFHNLDAKWDPVRKAAYKRAERPGLSPSEMDRITIPLDRKASQEYQESAERAAASQPKLASIPLGSRLSGSYKAATRTEKRLRAAYAKYATKAETTSYYYATYFTLADVLDRIADLGVGLHLNIMTISSMTNFAEDARLDTDDVRKKLARGIKDGKGYVRAYKKQARALPLPPEYVEQRRPMLATADRFSDLLDRLADAYAKKDRAELRKIDDELTKHRSRYDFLTAAIKPYDDEAMLKSPIKQLNASFEALKKQVEAL